MKKKLLIFMAAVSILSGAVIFLNKENENNKIIISGNVEMDRADISFRVPGIVRKIYFSEGQIVNKDDKLISLDKDIFMLKTKLSETDLELAEIKLKELINGSLDEDIKKTEIETEKNRINSETLKSEFDRATRLFKANSISESNYDIIKNQYNIADSLYRQSKLNLILIKKGPRHELIEYNKNLVRKNELMLQNAKLELSYTDLEAPFSGIISNIYCDTGENTVPGQTVVSIINPESAWIRTYVPEPILSSIFPGMKIQIKLDSRKDEILDGTLSYIADECEFTPKSVYTEDIRSKFVYMIKIRVNNNKGKLKNGMPCTVIF